MKKCAFIYKIQKISILADFAVLLEKAIVNL